MIVLQIQIIQRTVEGGEGDFRPDFALFQEPVEEDDEMINQFRRVIKSSDSFASVQVDPQIIDSLFPDHSLEDIQEALDKGTSPAEFTIAESTVSMGWSESDKVDTKEVPNVVGMIEGTDPELKMNLSSLGLTTTIWVPLRGKET